MLSDLAQSDLDGLSSEHASILAEIKDKGVDSPNYLVAELTQGAFASCSEVQSAGLCDETAAQYGCSATCVSTDDVLQQDVTQQKVYKKVRDAEKACKHKKKCKKGSSVEWKYCTQKGTFGCKKWKTKDYECCGTNLPSPGQSQYFRDRTYNWGGPQTREKCCGARFAITCPPVRRQPPTPRQRIHRIILRTPLSTRIAPFAGARIVTAVIRKGDGVVLKSTCNELNRDRCCC